LGVLGFWFETNSDPKPKTKNYKPKKMAFEDFDNMPISWADHEDVAIKLYERFGDEFTESKIYRIRFTELIEWVLEIPNFEGKREDCSEGHLEQIQAKWVYEWRDNQ
jgi:FeS assembly protein IscX